MQRVDGHQAPRSGQAPRQGIRKQQIAKLGERVGRVAVVVPLALQVVELDAGAAMG
jgi:hypothetical protein